MKLPISSSPSFWLPAHTWSGKGLLLVLLALPLAGCGLFSTYQKPKYDVLERRILPVPFRDLSVRYGHGYAESKRGARVVDEFRAWALKNFEPMFADSGDTGRVVSELREWAGPEITRSDWRRLLTGIDVDLVLVGDIIELRVRDPKMIGFYQGTVRSTFALIDARTGKELYRSGEIALSYPPPKELDIPLSEFATKSMDVERGLLRALGEQVGKDLYGYYARDL